MEEYEKSPLRIGWESARANTVPMVILWAIAVAMVAVYYLFSQVQQMLDPFVRWHLEWRWLSAFFWQAVFCGLVPGLFLLTCRTIRPPRVALTVVAQTIWSGLFGVACNELYRLFAIVFGDGTDWSSVVAKTLIDQFVWTVLVVAPANAVFFFWVGRDFSLARVRREWRSPFFRRIVLPNLVSNWIVWIPLVTVVFLFPFPLQIFVNGIVCSFWTLMCLQIGKRTGAASSIRAGTSQCNA